MSTHVPVALHFRPSAPRRSAVAFAAALVLLSVPVDGVGAADGVQIVACGADRSWVVDPATESASEMAGTTAGRSRAVERAGLRASLHVAPQGEAGRAGWWIVVEPRAGAAATREARRIPVGFERPEDLQWTPDGRGLVFAQAGDGAFALWQVSLEEPAGAERAAPRRLSPPGVSARVPRLAPDGRLAWLRQARREGKATFHDLVVTAPDAGERVLLADRPITTLEWSPDGSRLAVGMQGEIAVVDAADGTLRWSRRLGAIDEGLYAHHPASLAWRPDGRALAAVIHFSGGRSAGFGEEMPVIVGDREVFVIGFDGRVQDRRIELPADVERVEWRRGG